MLPCGLEFRRCAAGSDPEPGGAVRGRRSGAARGRVGTAGHRDSGVAAWQAARVAVRMAPGARSDRRRHRSRSRPPRQGPEPAREGGRMVGRRPAAASDEGHARGGRPGAGGLEPALEERRERRGRHIFGAREALLVLRLSEVGGEQERSLEGREARDRPRDRRGWDTVHAHGQRPGLEDARSRLGKRLAGENATAFPGHEAGHDRSSRRTGGRHGDAGLSQRAHRLDQDEIDAGLGQQPCMANVFAFKGGRVGYEVGPVAVLERGLRAGDPGRASPSPQRLRPPLSRPLSGRVSRGVSRRLSRGLPRGLPCQPHGESRERPRPRGQSGTPERPLLGAEGVGGEDLGAGGGVASVDLPDLLGGLDQRVGRPEGQSGLQARPLELRARRPIEQQRAVAGREALREARRLVGTGRLVPSECLARGTATRFTSLARRLLDHPRILPDLPASPALSALPAPPAIGAGSAMLAAPGAPPCPIPGMRLPARDRRDRASLPIASIALFGDSVTETRAPEIPADRPLAIFCDFDGTFSVQDVGSTLAQRLLPEKRKRLWQRFEQGELTAWTYAVALLDGLVLPEKDLDRFLETIDLDPGARAMLAWCQRQEVPFRILSDGFDWNLERLQAMNQIRFDYDANHLEYRGDVWHLAPGRPNPACGCGTGSCKRGLIGAYRARHPEAFCVHIGNGRVSDLCGALEADLAFAKDTLAPALDALERGYRPFETLHDVLEDLTAG